MDLLMDSLVAEHSWSHLCATIFTKDYSGQYTNPAAFGLSEPFTQRHYHYHLFLCVYMYTLWCDHPINHWESNLIATILKLN